MSEAGAIHSVSSYAGGGDIDLNGDSCSSDWLLNGLEGGVLSTRLARDFGCLHR